MGEIIEFPARKGAAPEKLHAVALSSLDLDYIFICLGIAMDMIGEDDLTWPDLNALRRTIGEIDDY